MFFFFKQKTAYEMRISDWSSDVCSSDLLWLQPRDSGARGAGGNPEREGAELFPLLRLSEAAIDRISDEPEDGGDRRALPERPACRDAVHQQPLHGSQDALRL